MKFRLIEKTEDFASAFTARSSVLDVGAVGGDSVSLVALADVDTPSAKTFDSGTAEVDTFTFLAKASTGAGDYMVVYDTAGLAWAAAADLTGSDPEPTGAVWTSIPAGRKVQVDLSAETTDAEVAAAFATALETLVGVPFGSADSTADVVCTQDLNGVIDAPEVHNADDSGAGSIVAAVTTPGVVSEVDVADNEITIPSHGLTEGLKGQLTTTGTLPAGLSLATDYFIIVVDANTVKLANSLANAQAGTAVDITGQGASASVNTFTPTALAGGSVKLQQSNDGENWVDLGSATNITVDANILLEKDRPTTRYVSALITLTAGHISASLEWLVKGDRDA